MSPPAYASIVVGPRTAETLTDAVRAVDQATPSLAVVAYGRRVEWLAETDLDGVDARVVVPEARSPLADSEVEPATLGSLPVERVPADGVAPVGIAVREFVDGTPDAHPVVFFDALTDLVDDVGLERAFRFVHVLRQVTASSDASLYFRADPDVDEEALETLRPLFGSVESR